MPTSVPPPDGEVVGVGTVMDTGQGDPELCLGAIAESYPPQCSGIPITNWDWAPVKDTSESSGTTRWGSYAVTGTYDGETFTVTKEPMSSALYDPAAPAENPFVTTCPEPDGGWAVVDDAKVSYEDQDAVYAAAAQLPTYAGSFIDQTSAAGSADDASGSIVNVLVTEDPEGAEAALRKVWGGPLCVTVSERHRGRARRDPGRPPGPARSAQQRPAARQAGGRRRLGRRHAPGLGRRGVRRGPRGDPPGPARDSFDSLSPARPRRPSEAGSRVRLIELMQ